MADDYLYNIIQEGIDTYRLYGTRPVNKPIPSPILMMDTPSCDTIYYDEAGERCGIPGYQLRILINFILAEPSGFLLSQMSDVLLQAKLSYDGDEIRQEENHFKKMKEVYQNRYDDDLRRYNDYLEKKKNNPDPMNQAVSKLIQEAKKFDPNLPFTSSMFGVVVSLHKFSGSCAIPGKFNVEKYKLMLESMEWDKVDALLDIDDDAFKQKIVSTAKGHACQLGLNRAFSLHELPDVIRL